jgi:hypothetical protein
MSPDLATADEPRGSLPYRAQERGFNARFFNVLDGVIDALTPDALPQEAHVIQGKCNVLNCLRLYCECSSYRSREHGMTL